MDINFNKNEDHNKLLLSNLKNRFAQVKLGGGTKRIEKLHAEGKMTARERIAYLLDEKSKSIERPILSTRICSLCKVNKEISFFEFLLCN